MILWPEEPPSHSLTLAGTPSHPHPHRLPLPQGACWAGFQWGEENISRGSAVWWRRDQESEAEVCGPSAVT